MHNVVIVGMKGKKCKNNHPNICKKLHKFTVQNVYYQEVIKIGIKQLNECNIYVIFGVNCPSIGFDKSNVII